MKKLKVYLVLVVLFLGVLAIRHYQSQGVVEKNDQSETSKSTRNNLAVFRDPEATYFFTKHARCRMTCRSITQKEVKEIVRKADANYTKSELDAARGPKYAVEGYTSKDRQHIRVIVAPKQRHLSIVTVIDLDKEWECPSCK